MKNLGHTLSVAVCAVALSALAACSGGEKEVTETETTTSETPAADAVATPAADNSAAPAAAVTFASLTGDAAKGATVFKQCQACHNVAEGKNGVGPSLHKLVGRTAGQVAGYSYSAANKASGLVWTPEQLYTYLEAPQKVVVGTKMSFAGLKKAQDRADVIAYLKTI
jgi:cytochrome c